MSLTSRIKPFLLATVVAGIAGCAVPSPIRATRTDHRSRADSTSIASVQPDESNRKPSAAAADKPWHLDFGYHGSHTKLAETKRMLDRRLEIPLRFDVFDVFHHPDTPLDRKSNLSLASLFVGVGRQESDWFIWNLRIGGGGASDHTHQRFLNANLEVSFRYALAYATLTAEIYPWKVPQPADGMDWSQCFAASRPFIVTGIQTGYVSGEGRGHYSIAPFRIYSDQEKIRDWITAYLVGLGWSIPLNGHWSVQLSGDYRFHFYRPDEYDSWTVSTAVRYNF